MAYTATKRKSQPNKVCGKGVLMVLPLINAMPVHATVNVPVTALPPALRAAGSPGWAPPTLTV